MADVSADDLLLVVEERMQDAVEAMQRDAASIRTGKASPSLVENLMVDYYGTSTRLRDIAGITAPEPRLLVIQPWDQSAVKAVEKAVVASQLGITPVSDGRVVRLPIPELSEERRRDLVKMVRQRSEAAKVEIRNARRDGNDQARKLEKKSEITEDDLAEMSKDVQKLTDEYVAEIDRITNEKEAELMAV